MHVANKKGFTLVELVIIVFLLSLLGMAGFARFVSLASIARNSTKDAVAGGVREGIALFHLKAQLDSTLPIWPSSLDAAATGEASAQNTFFNNVLKEGIDRYWKKISANIYAPLQDYNEAYVYNPNDGSFTAWGGEVGGGGPVTFLPVAADEKTSDENSYHTNPGQSGYSENGTAWGTEDFGEYTSWANESLIFSVAFSVSGDYQITIAARNNAQAPGQGAIQPRGDDWSLPTGYTHFQVEVYVDDVLAGVANIPASDTEIQTGNLTLNGISAGTHNISYKWVNDEYQPAQHQDANILFERVEIAPAP